jgi:hypothetical protein
MTSLEIQKLLISDCELEIQRAYFDWGTGNRADDVVLDWSTASADQRIETARVGYALYVGLPIPTDNKLSVSDIYAATGMNARLTSMDAARLLRHRQAINDFLAKLPAAVTLSEASEAQLGAAGALMAELDEEKRIGLGKVTKVLHKKRPAFFPVHDSVASDFLWKNFPHRISQGSPPLRLLQQYRGIVEARRGELESVQRNVRQLGYELSMVRVLDFLVWIGWHTRLDGNGSWPPLRAVWGEASAAYARQAAKRSWSRD